MNRWLILTLVLALAGCRSASREEADAHDAAHEGEHAHEGSHEDEHEEGHIRLTTAQQAASGIELGTAGPRTLALVQELPGEVVVNADRLAHIVPRFPGIAREVRTQLGDHVKAGEVLAIIESNESLSPYEVKSLIAGTVIEKHITLGEFVRDDSDIYMIADLSTVWVNVTVYARDLSRIRRGQRVAIRGAGNETAGEISYVGPVIGEATRTAVARVVLSNSRGLWRPGLFVTAAVEVEQVAVPVAVPDDAIQTLKGKTVVFVAEDAESFAPRSVELGRTGEEWIEIVSGLAAGERCVVKQSFILKSEHGKSEASHEH
jgi:cobalt-zinc-cadmium efflux system membrane fusion protein